MQILSDDYSKAAFLCQDRSIHFHAKFGQYYSTRVPSFGRDLTYAPFSADLLVVGSAPEVYRSASNPSRFCERQHCAQAVAKIPTAFEAMQHKRAYCSSCAADLAVHVQLTWQLLCS